MSSEPWIQLMRDQMPFASNRVSSLADAQVNVESIHRAAFEQMTAAADEARVRRRGGLGVVLWGDPGVGKSHLLARFAESIQQNDRGIFLLVHNLLVAPRLLASSLLKCFVAKLTGGGVSESSQSILYGWLYRQMLEAIPKPRGRTPDKIRADTARQLFLSHIEQVIENELPEHARPDSRRVAEVLFAYFFATYRLQHRDTNRAKFPLLRSMLAAAIRSLSGEELEPDEWRSLEMAPTTTAAHEAFEPNDQWTETVLLVLLEVARRTGSLIVLCFDQMENLSEERFVELFRFNHALLDHGRNLLIITSGVRSDMLALREQRLAPEAAWDRLAGETIELYFIGLNKARELLRARLESVHAAGCEIPEIAARLREDELFPLGAAWWRARTDQLIEVRPRDVISWAHQRWREQCRSLLANGDLQAAPDTTDVRPVAAPPVLRPEERTRLVDDRVAFKVLEKAQQLRDDPSSLPPDAGRLVGLLKAALQRCRSSHRWELAEATVKRGGKPNYDIILNAMRGDERRTIGIVVVVTAHATSAAAAYRRLLRDAAPPTSVVLVRDRRVPETLGAAGEKYRDELLARGAQRFRLVDVNLEEYAWLAALEAVLGDSRSGDLEVELPDVGLQRVKEQEVEQSHLRCGRYLESPLMRCISHLLTADAALTPALTEQGASELRAKTPAPTGDSPATPISHANDNSAPNDDSSANGVSRVTDDPAPADCSVAELPPELTLRDFILGELQLVAGIAARELAERLHGRFARDHSLPLEEFTRLVHDEAQRLHHERRLLATPTVDDLYLLLRP